MAGGVTMGPQPHSPNSIIGRIDGPAGRFMPLASPLEYFLLLFAELLKRLEKEYFGQSENHFNYSSIPRSAAISGRMERRRVAKTVYRINCMVTATTIYAIY